MSTPKARNSHGGANHTTPTATMMSTAPLSTRVIAWQPRRFRSRRLNAELAELAERTLSAVSAYSALIVVVSLGAERHRRRLDAAVAPIALLVGHHRLEQIAAAEVGPQRFGHPDLRIRDLPQQEVADAHLAARADEQIRIRLPRGVEQLPEAALVQVVGGDAHRDRAARGVHDLGAAAVVQRDVEQHAGIAGGLPDADLELVLHVGRELLGAADDAEADVVLEEGAELEPDVPLEQHHQGVDFGAGPLPVLDREGVERQNVDAEPRRGFDDVAHRIDAGPVHFD